MKNAWTTGHRLAWNVPHACKTYVPGPECASTTCVQPESGPPASRPFLFHGLLASPSVEARVAALLAARDQRSWLEAHLNMVRAETGLDPRTAGRAKLRGALAAVNSAQFLEVDSWRLLALHKLLEARLKAYYLTDVTKHIIN